MDCLIIGYSQPNRQRERQQFFHQKERDDGQGFGRYLRVNFLEFENDILLPNHVASLAEKIVNGQKIEKTKEGYFKEADITSYSSWQVPLLGSLFLYQYLLKNSFDVGYVKHAQLNRDKLDAFLSLSPKVIAISTTLILHPLDIGEVVLYCRERSPDSFIVLGGMTVWTEYLAKQNDTKQFAVYGADAVVLDSRAFRTLGKLVEAVKNAKSLDNVPNLLRTRGRSKGYTFRQEEAFDFNKDIMDWGAVSEEIYGKITWVQTQKSCPFKCSFCSFPVNQGSVLRAGMDVVEAELDTLHSLGVKYLMFVDDTFNVPKTRFEKILNLLKKYDFGWYSFIRSQYLGPEHVRDMKASGCMGAYLGIEAATDAMLINMDKNVTVNDYRKGIEMLKAADIPIYGSFVIGFPGETEETIQNSKDFIESSGIDYYALKGFYYDHCTPIHARRSEFDLSGNRFVWQHANMSSNEAFNWIEKLIQEIDLPHLPQNGGELWELAYFYDRGFSEKQVNALYRTFTLMQKESFANGPEKNITQQNLLNSFATTLGENTSVKQIINF